ncbi:GNAT family N-acetyltransferase [Pseudohaliea rubra]|nr:GNAT family N-acetyltransferase [Pseudohaliea rubra]
MATADHWEALRFDTLGVRRLYDILALRQAVFVVEQDCPYLDCDGLDEAAWHVFCRRGETLLAYQRCLPPGTPYPESSIGRIIVPEAARGRGLGRELVRRGIAFNREQWPGQGIRIGAQARLTAFYESLGFTVDGGSYDEDGIDHIHMTLPAESR